MTRNRFLILSAIVFSVALTSCSSSVMLRGIGSQTVHSTRAGSFMPNDVRLNMTMDDFQYLGVQEVSASYKQYLGFITVFNSINNQEVARRVVNIVNLSGNSNLPVKFDGALMRALHVALVNVPDADFVVPASLVIEKQQMFLGSIISKKLKVKMYKIKEK